MGEKKRKIIIINITSKTEDLPLLRTGGLITTCTINIDEQLAGENTAANIM